MEQAGQHHACNGDFRFPKSVCEYRRKRDVGNGKGVLEPVFLATAVVYQLLPVSEQLPQSTDFLTGDITGRNDVKLKMVGNSRQNPYHLSTGF